MSKQANGIILNKIDSLSLSLSLALLIHLKMIFVRLNIMDYIAKINAERAAL